MSITRAVVIGTTIILVGLIVLSGCAQSQPVGDSEAESSEQVLSGSELLQDRCTACHGLDRITDEARGADDWEQIVARMIQKGAVLTDDEQATLIEHLNANDGP